MAAGARRVRSDLRRLIVTQGDTEPASVEQQRMLAYICPSLYDMRNLFQVNVEEGRHLWAMVYLLHAHFGRDGREEAEDLLERHSGDVNNPRILTTFNEPIDDWMSFFSFTYFTDRDGKFQLKMLAESAFDPLSRTCRFMLTEEAHHMFVGETGLGRVIRRALEVMQELNTDDPQRIRDHGAMDLGLIQRYNNFWYSSSLDLFGADRSTNAAAYFANGLKGRPDEDRFEDHIEADTAYSIEEPTEDGAGVQDVEIATRNAMNLVARKGYSKDCDIGITRWNRTIRQSRRRFRNAPAVRPLPPHRRPLRRLPFRARRHADRPRGIREPGRRLDPVGRRQGPCQEHDETGDRARQDGGLDRAARPRHQQQPGRLRVCPAVAGVCRQGECREGPGGGPGLFRFGRRLRGLSALRRERC